ncbi:MAG: RusA family crossover junction endodeoxyribonuclease [Phycisphaerae bacterium]|jgi:Holliday junction resolvase RusA-like endonuclease
MIKFSIPGEPKGKGRPKFVRSTGIAFTPKDTANYENWVKCCYLETKQIKYVGNIPLGASITAFYQIPKSASKKDRDRMACGAILPMKKPDADNIVKIILDSLNGIAYDDDKQVCEVLFHKYYHEEPRVDVQIKVLVTPDI